MLISAVHISHTVVLIDEDCSWMAPLLHHECSIRGTFKRITGCIHEYRGKKKNKWNVLLSESAFTLILMLLKQLWSCCKITAWWLQAHLFAVPPSLFFEGERTTNIVMFYCMNIMYTCYTFTGTWTMLVCTESGSDTTFSWMLIHKNKDRNVGLNKVMLFAIWRKSKQPLNHDWPFFESRLDEMKQAS